MKALVIGGTSGLGRALAAEFLAAGWDTAVTGVREEALRDFSAAFPAAKVSRLDLSVVGAHARVETLISSLGGVDAAAVCAGLYADDPGAEWAAEEKVIAVNAAGCAAALNAAYCHFRKRGAGRLACITSIGGVRGNARCPAYNASKAFLFNYLEGLRQNAAAAGLKISVTNLIPAYVGEGNGCGPALLAAVLTGARSAYLPGYWRLLAAAYRNLPDFLHEKMARWHYLLLKPFMRRSPRWKNKQ
jgi:NAD(P)-dependent dehydrogenase (short-subunit alcohol dehydrogenase family)